MEYRNLSDSQVEAIMPGGVLVDNIGSDWERYVQETSYKYTGSTVQLMRTVSIVKRRLSQDADVLQASWNLAALKEEEGDNKDGDGEKKDVIKLPPLIGLAPREKYQHQHYQKSSRKKMGHQELEGGGDKRHVPLKGKSKHRRQALLRRRSSKSLMGEKDEDCSPAAVAAAAAAAAEGEDTTSVCLPILHQPKRHPFAKRGSIEHIAIQGKISQISQISPRLSRRRSVNLKEDHHLLNIICQQHLEEKDMKRFSSIATELGVVGRRKRARGWVVLRRLWINGTLTAYIKDRKV